ncbi:MAG: DHH family phosphoesterase [Bacilli bacterium]|nr:DHH family phosphoesterase [Bacilli bacterium]
MQKFFEDFTKLIKKHEQIIIMTHSIPDLDGMGSAIVLNEILNKFNKESYIVAPKKMIRNSLNKAIKYVNDEGYLIPFKHEKYINFDKALLIILDVSEPELLECEELIKRGYDTVIIDHHSLNERTIRDADLLYLNDEMSSIVEVITNYIKYLEFNVDKIFYTILLTGIFIDTNYFNLKTTPKTFETASYLLERGANLNVKQQILKENLNDVLERYSYIEKMIKIDEKVYLSIIDDKLCTNVDVAKLADEMLKFFEVKVALAIGKKNDEEILVSARSLGEVDVCEYMRKLGGGGHLAAAAALVESNNFEEVIEKLKNIIKGE